MPRIFLVWLVLASCIGWAVYQLKYEVQRLESSLARVNRQILADQEAIQILKAEWSYVNQPLQLQMLAKKFLELEPVQIKQMVDPSAVPQRRTPLPAGATAVASVKPVPLPPVRPAPAPPESMPLDLDSESTSAPEDLPDEPLPTATAPLLLVKGVPQ